MSQVWSCLYVEDVLIAVQDTSVYIYFLLQTDIGDMHTAGVSQALLLHDRSLTYSKELFILVGHAQSSLAIDFAGGGVNKAFLREWGEMRNAVWQPETLRMIKE